MKWKSYHVMILSFIVIKQFYVLIIRTCCFLTVSRLAKVFYLCWTWFSYTYRPIPNIVENWLYLVSHPYFGTWLCRGKGMFLLRANTLMAFKNFIYFNAYVFNMSSKKLWNVCDCNLFTFNFRQNGRSKLKTVLLYW